MIVLPGNTSHFHWAKSGEYITQVNAIGPLGLEYVNPKDDPRNENSGGDNFGQIQIEEDFSDKHNHDKDGT